MLRSKCLITRICLNARNISGQPPSQLLDSVLANATLAKDRLELFVELSLLGFSPHWASEPNGPIWIHDPNVGPVLLRCEQTRVTVH